jgi:hypothetical protein
MTDGNSTQNYIQNCFVDGADPHLERTHRYIKNNLNIPSALVIIRLLSL